jgi:probable selenium-dependent hydroxylase accessory protein YqeC
MPDSFSENRSNSAGTLCRALGLQHPGLVAVAGSGGKTALAEGLCAELAAAGQTVALSTTTHIYPPPARLCGQPWFWGETIPDAAHIRERLQPGRVVAVGRGMSPQGKLQGLSADQTAALAASRAWVVVEADGAARKPLKAWAPHEPAWPGGEMMRVVLAGASALDRTFTPDLVHRHQLFAQEAGIRLGDEITPQALARVLLSPLGPFRERPSGIEWRLIINQADAAQPQMVEALAGEISARAGDWLRLLKGKLRWGGLEPV